MPDGGENGSGDDADVRTQHKGAEIRIDHPSLKGRDNRPSILRECISNYAQEEDHFIWRHSHGIGWETAL